MVIVETGEFRCEEKDCGAVHPFLPEEPPQSAPHSFTCEFGHNTEVDADQVAAHYKLRGKDFPAPNEPA